MSLLKAILLLAGFISYIGVDAQDLFRIQSDIDESSCLCGINKVILDDLENILKQSRSQCSNTTPHINLPEVTTTLPPLLPAVEEIFNPATESEQAVLETTVGKEENDAPTIHGDKDAKTPEPDIQLPDLMQQMGGQMTKLSSGFERIEMLLEKLVEKMSTSPEPILKPTVTPTITATVGPTFTPIAEPQKSNPNEPVAKPNQTNRENESWFLTGLKPIAEPNESLMKLNHSKPPDQHTMETTLQSTVPNVVTNIFTNIESLQDQIQKQPSNGPITSLTSVDGSSSIDLPKTSSNALIMSQGEKLLLLWVEKQIESLHVTASVANHLRKTALNMFRSIMKQYTDRMGQIGSNLGQNMRTVTQIALNNTQSLISFILKNYMNIAGGLMQIIGERVSFVGKHLDLTGASIAHLPLNPFDIFSNVMESLPNPSNYSKYFRAFGKQLLGEDEPTRTELVQPAAASGVEDNSSKQPAAEANKQIGIFSKTMGALSKTFGSFLG